MPTPEQTEAFEKHLADFIEGFQALASFPTTESLEYREAWAKTQTAKEAIDALIAQNLPRSDA